MMLTTDHREDTVTPSDHPVESAPTASPNRGMKVWLAAAMAVGLAGLGVGIYALANGPVKQGETGPPGVAGATGPRGLMGPVGPEGPQGVAGSLAGTKIVNGTAVVSAPNPPKGTVAVAKTTCPVGELLLSGGAQVSAQSVEGNRNVSLRESFPLNTTTWQTVAITNGPLGATDTMTLRPFVVCGQK
jgi:hypothetical protein